MAERQKSHGLSDEDLRAWAREHLVYEAQMFAYAAVELGRLQDKPRDHRSNSLLECFAVHTRCLRDFLWHDRKDRHMDAFAADFCAPGIWKSERGDIPPALKEVKDRNRLGREVMHLTYFRAAVPAEIKDWPVSDIVHEIVTALDSFTLFALPSRLDEDTANALEQLTNPLPPGVGPESVATGIQVPYSGGTISLDDFTVGS